MQDRLLFLLLHFRSLKVYIGITEHFTLVLLIKQDPRKNLQRLRDQISFCSFQPSSSRLSIHLLDTKSSESYPAKVISILPYHWQCSPSRHHPSSEKTRPHSEPGWHQTDWIAWKRLTPWENVYLPRWEILSLLHSLIHLISLGLMQTVLQHWSKSR